jgi:CubicO group peptidase (beta-lactamase class C family)
MVRSASLVSSAGLGELFAAQGNGYGLGWDPRAATVDSGGNITQGPVQKTGGADGADTILQIYPASGIVVAVMANTRRSQSAGNRATVASQLAQVLNPTP